MFNTICNKTKREATISTVMTAKYASDNINQLNKKGTTIFIVAIVHSSFPFFGGGGSYPL